MTRFGTTANLALALVVSVGPVASIAGAGSAAAWPVAAQVAAPGSAEEEFIVAASAHDAAAAGLDVVAEIGFGWTLVTDPVPFDGPEDERAAEIASALGFEVEPNYRYELADEPLFPDQWSLENTGQTGGSVDADIDIEAAWAWTTGASTVVAVLDTGVAFTHPDLSSRIWVNSDEVPGNGLDDDGNGFIDDRNGWDALSDDSLPNDTHGHGTFVSTTAVAAVNGVGMAGVAPGSVVMPIRVCDADCPLSAIVTGLAYAIDNGADVINLSFGGSFFPISNGMEEAIQDAVDSGITVVAAAGNETRNNDLLPFFPANYDIDGLISVAASDDNDALAAFSNYGATSVDMTAPGEAVIGGWEPDDWAIGSGTSFAAPVVAGVAALVKTLRPDLNPAQVAEMLLASVDVQPSLAGKMVSGGRINAGSAMVLATMPVAVAKVTPSSGILPFTVQLDGGESFDPVGEISSWSWELPDGSVVAAPQATWAPTKPGEYLATLTVVDSDGLSDSDSVSITATLRPGGTFVDDNEHFAEGAVEAIAAERITSGCNPPGNDRFCPQDVVTRGQMAAFLARALSLPPTSEDFFDDDDGSVFEAAIDKLAAARITIGCNPPANTRFCPSDPVTRGQMAAFLSRAFGLPGGESDAFQDDDGSVFESAIDRLATAGITAGCNPPTNDRFCPDSPVRRGEMAVFLARALDLTPFYPPPAD